MITKEPVHNGTLIKAIYPRGWYETVIYNGAKEYTIIHCHDEYSDLKGTYKFVSEVEAENRLRWLVGDNFIVEKKPEVKETKKEFNPDVALVCTENVNEKVKVTLNSPYTIRYNTNGKRITNLSKKYESPFEVSKGTKITIGEFLGDGTIKTTVFETN